MNVSPYENLCTYDKRNPYGYLSYGPIDDDDVAQPRQQGCACDNCFHGRDRLAMEIIRLRDGIAKHQQERLPHMTNADDRALWSLIENR